MALLQAGVSATGHTRHHWEGRLSALPTFACGHDIATGGVSDVAVLRGCRVSRVLGRPTRDKSEKVDEYLCVTNPAISPVLSESNTVWCTVVPPALAASGSWLCLRRVASLQSGMQQRSTARDESGAIRGSRAQALQHTSMCVMGTDIAKQVWSLLRAHAPQPFAAETRCSPPVA